MIHLVFPYSKQGCVVWQAVTQELRQLGFRSESRGLYTVRWIHTALPGMGSPEASIEMTMMHSAVVSLH